MIRDSSSRSVVSVCACGARDVAAGQAAADAWLAGHLVTCQVVKGKERDRITSALYDRRSRR